MGLTAFQHCAASISSSDAAPFRKDSSSSYSQFLSSADVRRQAEFLEVLDSKGLRFWRSRSKRRKVDVQASADKSPQGRAAAKSCADGGRRSLDHQQSQVTDSIATGGAHASPALAPPAPETLAPYCGTLARKKLKEDADVIGRTDSNLSQCDQHPSDVQADATIEVRLSAPSTMTNKDPCKDSKLSQGDQHPPDVQAEATVEIRLTAPSSITKKDPCKDSKLFQGDQYPSDIQADATVEIRLIAPTIMTNKDPCTPKRLNSAPPVMRSLTPFTPRVIDTKRCMARTWGGGLGAQCSTRLRADAGKNDLCHLHARHIAHGRVDGPVPPAKLEEFRRAAKRRLC